jgi:hypothetical protein
MYAGSGTVSEKWQQAQNLINQQTQIIISELVEKERQLGAAKRATEDAKRALESYKTKPDSYSEGWYVKELGKAREARQKLESDLRRAQGFMKLKDQSKIKVERVRDIALRDVKNLKNINEVLRSKALKSDSLVTANEQQAIAWKRAVEEKRQVQLENARLKDENKRLMEVLRLGREGLKNEQW